MSFRQTADLPEMATVVFPEDFVYHDRQVEVDGRDGYITQAILTQQPRTSGVSPDVIRVHFDRPVEVLGVNISVDIGSEMHLVEVAAGIGWDAYGADKDGALMHTSYSGRNSGKIDEQVWFVGGGFLVDTDEWVAVSAWLQNASVGTYGVSPEVIIWYQPGS